MPQRDTHGSILWHFLRPGQSTTTKRYYLNLFLSSDWWPFYRIMLREWESIQKNSRNSRLFLIFRRLTIYSKYRYSVLKLFEYFWTNNVLTVQCILYSQWWCQVLRYFICMCYVSSLMHLSSHTEAIIYTLCSEKKHPLPFSFISSWVICGFKQKLQWIYPRIDRFWKCKN